MRIIRNRVFFLVSLIVAVTMTVMFLVTSYFLMKGFGQEEVSRANEEANRATELLSSQIDQLNLKLADWAQWDDSYEFIQDPDPDYIKSNVNNEALKILGIESMIFVNDEGRIVQSLSIDPETGTEMSLPRGLEEHLRKGDFLLSHEDVKSAKKGVLNLDDGPVMVASQPVVKSDGEGPAKGTIVFVSYLDKKWQKDFTGIIHFPFSVASFRDPRLSREFSQAKAGLSADRPVTVTELNDETLAVFGLMPDVYGEPGLLFRMEISRDMHQQGMRTLYVFAFLLAAIGLLFFSSLSSLLRREVLARLEQLSEVVSEIRLSGGSKIPHISISGDDEIAQLAEKINEMVDVLRKTKLRGEESERRFQTIADTTPIMIWMSDKTGLFTYLNKGWLEYTGREFDDVIGEGYMQDIHILDREKAVAAYREAFEKRRPFRTEFRLRRHDGEYRYMLGNGVPYYAALGEFLGYVGVCFDIQDRHAVEMKREERIEEVEKLNAVMISRELRMVELKEEVKRLRKELDEMGAAMSRKKSGRSEK
jgi:PAS domain S-box-containing protein